MVTTNQDSHPLLAIVAAIIFGGVAVALLGWTKALRDYGLKDASRNIERMGNPEFPGNLLIRWTKLQISSMESPLYLWLLRFFGVVSLCAVVLVVMGLLRSKQH
jgi:hypothetical protein